MKTIVGHNATIRARKNKSNDLAPHQLFSNFSDNVTVPVEDTKTAVAFPHGSESTKESIAGWWTFGLDVRLEFLWWNYGTSYVKKMEVEVLPVLNVSEESFFFCHDGLCNMLRDNYRESR